MSSCDRLFASKHSMKAHVLRQHRRHPGGPLAAAGAAAAARCVLDARPRATAALPAHPRLLVPPRPSCPLLSGSPRLAWPGRAPEARLDLVLCAELPLRLLLSSPAQDSRGVRTDCSWTSTRAERKQ